MSDQSSCKNENGKLLIVKMDVHIENRTSSPSSPKKCRSRKPSVVHLDGQGQDCPSSKISHSMCSGARARSTECAWCRGVKKKGAHRKTLLASSMLKEKNAKSCIKCACESKILLFSSVTCVHENRAVLFVCVASSAQPSQGGALAFHTWTRPTCHFAARHR